MQHMTVSLMSVLMRYKIIPPVSDVDSCQLYVFNMKIPLMLYINIALAHNVK